ncbi:hypothetical protein ACFP51_00760 [Streptomyces pratens]|uniref:Uncharacterized protein n=1 Tax=Streptomyces pratens TaxID=887456 RepID=A0ABW1LUR0_9ACTN
MNGVLETAVYVLAAGVGLGCAWLGWQAVRRPRRPPELVAQVPVRVVRVWGFSFTLLGVLFAVKAMIMAAGGNPGRVTDLITWVAGPLVVGSVLAAYVSRRRERRRARAAANKAGQE